MMVIAGRSQIVHENPLSILAHSKWAEILPHLYVQQGGGLNGPRHRIEADAIRAAIHGQPSARTLFPDS